MTEDEHGLDGEVFASVLPLLLGGFAIWINHGHGWWSAVVKWVAEGTLMPPAVLLCAALVQGVNEVKSPKLRTNLMRGLLLYGLAVVGVFIGSVDPQPNVRSTHAWAELNAILYIGVVGLSASLDVWRRQRRKAS